MTQSYPLSSTQREIWFDQILHPDVPLYNIGGYLQIDGPVDPVRFEQALNQVIQENDALRIILRKGENLPVQVFAEEVLMTLEVHDFSDKENPPLWAQKWMEKEFVKPFKLYNQLLFQFALLKLSENGYYGFYRCHHLIVDGWAISLMAQRLATAYNTLGVSQFNVEQKHYYYLDFIKNDQAYLNSDKLTQHKHYWLEKYQTLPAPLISRQYAVQFKGQTIPSCRSILHISRAFYNQIIDFSKKNKVSTFHLILGVLYCYFVRIYDREDLVIGLPVLNRNTAAFKKTVGLFASISPAWFQFGTDMSFVELIQAINTQLKKDYRHQRFPVSTLNKQLGLHKDGRRQLFDLTLSYEKHDYNTHFNGSPALAVNFMNGFEQNALAIFIREFHDNQDVRVDFEYSLGAYQDAEIERLKTRFEFLLAEILRQPERRVREMQIMPEAEYQKILVEFNDTEANYPRDKTIVNLFEEQVEKTPHNVAVVFEGQQLTYQTLNTRANQLAHYLLSLGVKPEVLVGLCVERSFEMVIGLLGILKAGGAYVPLDPSYPTVRLAFMLEDTKVPVLLTQESLKEKLPKITAQVVCLDTEWNKLSRLSSDNPSSGVEVDNLAYVIYTSGSTGQPKGVMIQHLSLINLLTGLRLAIYANHDNAPLRVSMNGPLAFDTSVKQIIQLLQGHILDIVPDEVRFDKKALLVYLQHHQIDVFDCTPSQLSLFISSEEFANTDSVPKVILIGGESLENSTWQLLQRTDKTQFYNVYGPTECTVDATFGKVSTAQLKPVIGFPLANTQIYLLDRYLKQVPIGVPGELHIGGTGLTRGYLNRPELTAEKFIPNPFSQNNKNARIYQTGDLARYLPDGNIEYLGRIDHQVKIRGFRIELGEIEVVLAQHPAVQGNAVIVQSDASGNKRLVAYVVPNQKVSCFKNEERIPETLPFPTHELRHFLQQKLPDYMIPSFFVPLTKMPLTPNGKIDRQLLAGWVERSETHQLQLSEQFVAPRTPVEELLADIWANVLGIERVGIHDNFFELGGDSILGIQLISHANKANLQFTLRQLFQHQTIAELATVTIGSLNKYQAEQGLVTGFVPLTPIQHWFFEQHLPEPHHYNQAVWLEVSQSLTPAYLEQIVRQLLQHHDALRLRFSEKQLLTDNCSLITETGGVLTSKDLSELTGDEQRITMESTAVELQASLNLSEGQLLRVALFHLGNNQPNRLLFIIHHLAVDGVSWRILLEDLVTAYQQLTRGEAITLPPKTTSFKQWAERLTEYAQSEILAAEVEYWLAKSHSRIKPLPVDYPASPLTNTLASSAHQSVSLSVEQTQALLQDVPHVYHTQVNDVLLTALVQSFAGWTCEPVLLIDLEGHGREDLFEDIDSSRTVGWFTSIFPVLLDLSPLSNRITDNGSLITDTGEAIKSIKEQLRQIPNRGIGYGLLRYLSNAETAMHLQTLPIAEVSFNYLGQFQHWLSQEPIQKVAQESSGATQSRQGYRRYLLEINSLINDGQLQIDWTYSENCHQRSTIEHLAQDFLKALTAIIAHCQSAEAGGYTPSDFPLANIEQATLDKILGQRQVHDLYPLSHTQQGMLFHTLYAPDSGVYLEQLNVTFEGILNISAFQQAWQQVIDRHPVLRTAFVWEGLDTPLQIVSPQVKLPWVQLDWRGLTTVKQQEQLATFLQAEQEQGLDLTQAPLMRCTLIQVADETHQLIWTHHHLLMDGWCLPILFKEMLAFYEAFCQGKVLSLEQPRPYRDYIAWLQQQSLKQAEAFWKGLLKGFTAPTPFQVDNRSEKSAFRNNDQEQTLLLSKNTTEALHRLAKQHHLTLNILVQGAWALLLSRYSGDSDVVFGATVSGRPAALAGVESMVGLFINTLPVRVSASPNTLLLPWLQQLQTQQIEQEQYSYTPLIDIQGWSEVPSGLSLFESIIVFENYPIDSALREPRSSGLKIAQVHAIERTHYPLTIAVIPASELLLKVSYDGNRFETDVISRMLGHVKTLLEGMVANPEQKIGELPLLTEAECHQLLVTWNDTQTDYPKETCIHQLFEAQVERTPDAIAVVFEEQRLTYQDLNQKANQLAHYLQTLGIKPEVLVGLCIERSVEMVIGLLGILKAGGAYVPLDPSYPTVRLAFMLEDAKVPVLLTQESLKEKLSQLTAQVICLDTEWKRLSRLSSENPSSGVGADNLAYVIYTSGSTGRPKGVMIQHQSLVNFIETAMVEYGLTEHDRILQFASINFDAAAEEIYPCLACGGTLVLRFDELLSSVPVFLQHCRNLELTVLDLPTAFWHQVVVELATAGVMLPDSLRLCIIGGERAGPESVRLWQQRIGKNPSLINTYGPTEATVVATMYQLPGRSVPLERKWQEFPIGRAISNVQTYVLSKYIQPVSIGVPGELYLGGTGLARGYLCRPDLTADKFVPNPFNDGYGARLYKTGDLARYLPNGNLEYLGRIDNQVKIRGFRIELSEIETQLALHPAVRENVVIVHEPKEGDKRLVAYWVVQSEQLIDNTTLRAFVKEKLPDYMVPSALVPIDAIPLTPNGKIDRRALEQLSVNSWKNSGDTLIAPRTPEEELLVGIWSEVLGVEQVGVHDNFFEIGGHSLLATVVISRIRDTLSIELPLRRLFEFPTIAGLCEHLSETRRDQPLPPITAINRDEPLPMSFAQQRLWFLDQLEGGSATYNMFAAVRLEGSLHQAALEQSLTQIVQRHETLRTTFPAINGKPAQVIQPLPITHYLLPILNLQALPIKEQNLEIQQLINKEAQQTFDLSLGPLFRTTLLQFSQDSYVLLVNMHHIISDGWSIGVLIREISALYEAFLQSKPSPLSRLPVQYADFAHWQRQWLIGETLDKQFDYWKKQLAGAPALLQLPTDHPRPPVLSFHGHSQRVEINQELTDALQQLSQQSGSTLFMTLLAAFATLLSRYSEQSDIVIGSPIANRTLSQIEPLIGFFVNTLVLRINLEGNPHFDQLLGQVRQMALDAYAHQDCPFEQLVEELKPARTLSHTPLFQVMFVLQNAPMAMIELPGLTLTPIVSETAIAKFDLTLSLEKTSQGLTGTLAYNTDLFERATIERMVGHFQTLLEGIVENPLKQIYDLPLLTDTEYQQLMTWNDTAADYPQNQCIHQLFEAQVKRTPEAIAVVFENQQLTYRELNTKANQLAHYLQTLGVKPEILVGICIERSVEMVIGLLGILKVGGAYVPLDPSYPTVRLAFMLEDAKVPVLLTQESLKEKLSQITAQVICLDTEWKRLSRLSSENPSSGVGADNLAYVIYTSGSTGQPKGVMIQHLSVLNLLAGLQQAIYANHRNAQLRVSMNGPLAFDTSVKQFIRLLQGNILDIVPDEVRFDKNALLTYLRHHQIDVFDCTPSQLSLFISSEEFANTDSVPHAILIGGESLDSSTWQLLQRTDKTQFYNVYGPTECTVDATFCTVSTAPVKPVIGHPLINTQVYILDPYLNQVPIGVPGELHIGGAGLARGYLNRPELTAKKFIPNPFRDDTKARLYKTGDLACYLPDGNIEYVGRIDNQVKIRGFRIELGEIEAILAQYLAIQECTVIVREQPSHNQRLVAYLVLKPEQTIEATELRRFLQEKLPDYMIPSTFVSLEAMPLTPNGKIDRRALSQLSVNSEQLSGETFVAPRTPMEELLASIWAEILALERVGVHDNFFELGGHSLLATVVISRIRDTFAVELPLNNLFKYPTVAELTERIEISRGAMQALQGPIDNPTNAQQEEEEGTL